MYHHYRINKNLTLLSTDKLPNHGTNKQTQSNKQSPACILLKFIVSPKIKFILFLDFNTLNIALQM